MLSVCMCALNVRTSRAIINENKNGYEHEHCLLCALENRAELAVRVSSIQTINRKAYATNITRTSLRALRSSIEAEMHRAIVCFANCIYIPSSMSMALCDKLSWRPPARLAKKKKSVCSQTAARV